MAKYLSNRQKNLKIGIVSYTESNTVLEVTGKVGIGTTNATQSVDLNGGLRLRGALYNANNQPGSANQVLISTGSAVDWANAAPPNAITGLTIHEEGVIVGSANSVSLLNFVGPNITATSIGSASTITVADYVSIAGYSTNSGIATYASVAGVATALQYSRLISLSGDVVGSVSFDGTQNVSIAATIQPDSVGLGTDTTGEYVKSISGTTGQITVSSGTGEGSTPVVAIDSNPTIGGNVTIGNDLQVNNNLNVTGNITIGGTSAYVIANDFRVKDADIILGFTTNISGADVSNDTTANHGGIAIASTEGSPLIQLVNTSVGETSPSTYKKIMWFKSGSFAGLNTDAWLFNYAVGIGSTQFPVGTRLAAGSVQFTENDLAVVRNINASGVVTASSFSGNASSATYSTSSGFSTVSGVSTSVIGGIASVTQLSVSGVSTFSNIVLNGTVSIASTVGNSGQYLQSTGVGVSWASFPTVRTTQSNVATDGQTMFSFAYNVNFLDVFVNGVKLTSSEYTATNGTTITLSSPAFANDIVEFVSYNTTTIGGPGGSGASIIDDLTDVALSLPVSAGENLSYNGTSWVNDYTVIATSSSTSQTTLHSLSASTYRSVEYIIQATRGTNYHVTKLLVIHDGTLSYPNEYGTLFTNGELATYDIDISGGEIRLMTTPSSASFTTYKIKFTAIKV